MQASGGITLNSKC